MNPTVNITDRIEPWYRAPMLWLALSLPLATVIAGIATYHIAARDSADAAPDTVRRVAQMQTADLAQDEMAARLGLQADAIVNRGSGRLVLRIKAAHADFPGTREPLRLRFIHATQAKLDRTVALTRTDSGDWGGVLPADRHGTYSVALGPFDSRWRLVGLLGTDSTVLNLRPLLRSRDE